MSIVFVKNEEEDSVFIYSHNVSEKTAEEQALMLMNAGARAEFTLQEAKHDDTLGANNCSKCKAIVLKLLPKGA